MLNVLTVSPSARTIELLRNFVATEVPIKTYAVSSGAEARRSLTERDYDVVFIDTPLQDEFGNELALYSAETMPLKSIIIAVKTNEYSNLLSYLGREEILIIPKPFNRTQIIQTLRVIKVFQDRFEILSHTNANLKQRLDEMRIINQAKFILIDKMKINENEAHRYIEKKAMDWRISKYRVALKILDSVNVS